MTSQADRWRSALPWIVIGAAATLLGSAEVKRVFLGR